METHPDNRVPDLRLDATWPELQQWLQKEADRQRKIIQAMTVFGGWCEVLVFFISFVLVLLIMMEGGSIYEEGDLIIRKGEGGI